MLTEGVLKVLTVCVSVCVSECVAWYLISGGPHDFDHVDHAGLPNDEDLT